MKKLSNLSLLLVLLFGLFSVSAQADSGEIIISYGGERIFFPDDSQPFIQDGRTLVPVRKIFETLGAEVNWDETTNQITSSLNGTDIILTIDSRFALVNSAVVELDVPAQLSNDRTFVPLRFVSESLGYAVIWDEASQSIKIYDYTYGTYTYVTGEKYIGNYIYSDRIDCLPHGYGTQYYKNGNKEYEGYFFTGDFEGTGKYYDENGFCVYSGEWAYGMMNGAGTVYQENGEYAIADFINGDVNTQVTYYNPDGTIKQVLKRVNGELVDVSTSTSSQNSASDYEKTMALLESEVQKLINEAYLEADRVYEEKLDELMIAAGYPRYKEILSNTNDNDYAQYNAYRQVQSLMSLYQPMAYAEAQTYLASKLAEIEAVRQQLLKDIAQKYNR